MQAKSYFYWNLHKKCWSHMVRGKVVDHTQAAQLTDVEFRVRKAGHARVLREGRKNVHAFAVAALACAIRMETSDPERWPGEWIEVGYNPFLSANFRRKDTGECVHHATRVILTHDRRVLAQGLR